MKIIHFIVSLVGRYVFYYDPIILFILHKYFLIIPLFYENPICIMNSFVYLFFKSLLSQVDHLNI